MVADLTVDRSSAAQRHEALRQDKDTVQIRPLKASVIVPTYNRLGRLQHVIAALEKQRYPTEDYEVIVVSDGSSDGTDDYLKGYDSKLNLRWFTQANQGPAAARNLGIGKAIGELVVFVDDDVVPQPQLLAVHVRAHSEAGRDVVVIGPLLSPEGFVMSPWVRWEQEMLMKQYRALLSGVWEPSARQFYTGNASLPRAQFMAAGGFDQNFRRAEDVELAYRLADRGLDFVFKMDAVGMHFAERSFNSWLDAAYTYGRNDVIFTRDRKQKWLLPAIETEFHQRHILIRSLVRLCRRRPWLASLTTSALKLAANAATLLHADRIERAAYSGLFNLQYYRGLFDEIGDAKSLFRTSN